MHPGFLACLMALMLSACTLVNETDLSRSEPFIAFALASEHVGAERDFVETNPGVGVGTEVPVGTRPIGVGAELGVFRNSFDDTSPYAVVFAEGKVNPFGAKRPIGLGAFYGYGRYPTEVERARERGFLVIGEFVPVGGLQVTVPVLERNDLRFRIVPGVLESTSTVIAIQANVRF